MRVISDIGIQIPLVHLPAPGIDLQKWAVIACDQYTSEPEFWQQVEGIVGEAPSTLKLTLPEVYLETPGEEERIAGIQRDMRKAVDEGILQPHDGLVYVERTVSGKTRKGVMLCLDLDRYDFERGSTSLIRATEGTIVDRLPPRMKIREGAMLELPHILVLIDDPEGTVIEPLAGAKATFETLYDFELMLDGGHLAGYAVSAEFENGLVGALRGLADPGTFASKYGLGPDAPILLFAMGDGNHSLATAKAIWEKMKSQAGMDHPARYALVEVVNIHDPALEFEPIHRVLFGTKKDIFREMQGFFGSNYKYSDAASGADMMKRVDAAGGDSQLIGVVGGGQQFGVLEIANPPANLAVGTLQVFLDAFLADGGAESIDYVHGGEVVERLSLQAGNVGFYLAGMHKDELFKTVILDGALPRKTFSMGEAHEKRFYMEARRITR